MKLLAYVLNGEILGVDKPSWSQEEFDGTPFLSVENDAVVPDGYVAIDSLVNWGRLGSGSDMNYVQIRNELKAHLPDGDLTEEEIEILKNYNLYSYFRIYDRINDGYVIQNLHPPVDIDYDLLGYNKKRIFNKGELVKVEYYENYNQATNVYTTKVVEELRTYYRVNQMINKRVMIINWIMDDNTVGFSKTTTKYYSLQEGIQAGETRRATVVSDLKITVVGLLMMSSGATSVGAQNSGRPFLNTYSMEIAKYIQGFETELRASILSDTLYSWMNLTIPGTGGITIRQYLIGELTIDYSLNNVNM